MSSHPSAIDALIEPLYHELRALARSHLRREREGHTLSTTALVHEAWLRMATQSSLGEADRAHFFIVASSTMRRVLVDHARRRQRVKRGMGATTVSLHDAEPFLSDAEADEIVALDDALERLAVANPRASEVVMLRFFGGLSEEETASLLGVSAKTAQRDWLAARAWLRKEVAHDLGVLADLPPDPP